MTFNKIRSAPLTVPLVNRNKCAVNLLAFLNTPIKKNSFVEYCAFPFKYTLAILGTATINNT